MDTVVILSAIIIAALLAIIFIQRDRFTIALAHAKADAWASGVREGSIDQQMDYQPRDPVTTPFLPRASSHCPRSPHQGPAQP